MLKYKYLFVFLFGLQLLAFKAYCAVQPDVFYVSTKGNDNADGKTINTAFATLEKARDAIRALKQANKLNGPIHVLIIGGTYDLKQTFSLGESDSGTPAHPITYAAYNTEKVILSGGQTVAGWKPYKNGMWMAKLPAKPNGESYQFRELYVNGTIRQIAKSPNAGYYRVKAYPDSSEEAKTKPLQFFEYYDGNINAKWTDLTNVEVMIYHFWKDTHLQIASVDAKNHMVSFQYKAGRRFSDDKNKELGARYIVKNAFEALDTAGEWYLNKKENVVYYYPLAGEDMQKVVVTVPVLPELLRIEGKAEELSPAAYVNFKNIDFKYCGWVLQAGNINNAQGSAAVTGSITLKGAQHCSFENCTIQNISNFAFDIMNGSSYNTISNCQMTSLGAGGVKINGAREKEHPLLATGYNTINDNSVYNYGEVFPSACGIFLLNTSNNLVSHNLIHDGYYTGISVGIMYDYLRSVSNYNIIEYNNIYNIGKGVLSDMGGIYTLGVSPGTIIRNNVIHDIKSYSYGGWGIYCDEASSYILIENNIVYNTQFATFNIHYSKELIVRNNIFCLGEIEQLSRSKKGPFKSMYFEKNIIYWKKGALLKNWKKEELMSNDWTDYAYKYYSGKHGDLDQTNTFDMDYNLYYNPSLTRDAVRMVDKTWDQWKKFGKDIHSIYQDPLFVNADQYDFTLKPNSPAFKLGFKAIDLKSVGPRKMNVN